MRFDSKALVLFTAFLVMVLLAVSAPGSAWVYLADGIVTVIILLGIGGLLRLRTTHNTR